MTADQARTSKAPKTDNTQEETPHLSEIAETIPEQAFDNLRGLAAQLCKVPLASVNLIEACRQWLQSGVDSKHIEPPIDFTFCAHTLLRADCLLVPDTWLDERFATSTLVTADPPIRFYAGIPLFATKGQALGVLCVMDYVPRELNLEQVEALRVLGDQVVTQLELMRNLSEKERTVSNQFIHTRCFTQDISVAKQLEEARRERDEALSRSTRLKQAILDSANCTITAHEEGLDG